MTSGPELRLAPRIARRSVWHAVGLASILGLADCAAAPMAASPTSRPEAPAPSTNSELACASSGYANGKELVGAFATTVGEVRATIQGGSGGPIPPEVPDSEFAVLCYFDGEIPKGPPPDPSGTPQPSFDRIIVAVVGGDSTMIVAGYRDRLAVVDPSQ